MFFESSGSNQGTTRKKQLNLAKNYLSSCAGWQELVATTTTHSSEREEGEKELGPEGDSWIPSISMRRVESILSIA